jgi:hypothetical protein
MVEVPSEAYNFEGCKDGCSGILEYQLAPDELTGQGIQLPSGTWHIHSDSLTITEEQAGEIVGRVQGIKKDRYVHYVESYTDHNGEESNIYGGGYFITATDSYRSLLRSKQINSRVINLVRI